MRMRNFILCGIAIVSIGVLASIAGGYPGGYSMAKALWGDITGTLSNQTDLQAALDAKTTMTGYTLVVDSGDWYGWAAGAGSTTNNGGTFTGYSTANATNNSNAGWGYYCSQTYLCEKYAYGFARAPATASGIGTNGIVVLVRSSVVGSDTNKVDILFDSADGSWTNISAMVSDTAGEWNTYQLTSANIPAAWSNTVPTVTLDGVPMRGLNVRADFFSSHSNYVSCRVFVDWN